MVGPNSSLLVAALYLGPMGCLWMYIEGMDVRCLLFAGANGSDLAAWGGFGTLALFGRRLLLLYVMGGPNSSLLVAALYLGSMGCLCMCVEGMDVRCLLFAGANGSDLAAWGGFGTLALFEDVYSSCMLWWGPILLCLLQHCIWAPWDAFGCILKEWMSVVSFLWGQTAPIWLPGAGLALWPSLEDVYSSCMLWWGPILLCLLQHCIWAPWDAFGCILKEWMSVVSFLWGQTAPIWLPGAGVALWRCLED